jgi:hypothetical protein
MTHLLGNFDLGLLGSSHGSCEHVIPERRRHAEIAVDAAVVVDRMPALEARQIAARREVPVMGYT